jgi:hypothetical protein
MYNEKITINVYGCFKRVYYTVFFKSTRILRVYTYFQKLLFTRKQPVQLIKVYMCFYAVITLLSTA